MKESLQTQEGAVGHLINSTKTTGNLSRKNTGPTYTSSILLKPKPNTKEHQEHLNYKNQTLTVQSGNWRQDSILRRRRRKKKPKQKQKLQENNHKCFQNRYLKSKASKSKHLKVYVMWLERQLHSWEHLLLLPETQVQFLASSVSSAHWEAHDLL